MRPYRRGPLVTGHTAQARAEAAWMADMADEVPADALTAEQKRAVWAHVQRHHPERAAFLRGPEVEQLRALGFTPTFPRALVRASLQPQPQPQRSPRHAV